MLAQGVTCGIASSIETSLPNTSLRDSKTSDTNLAFWSPFISFQQEQKFVVVFIFHLRGLTIRQPRSRHKSRLVSSKTASMCTGFHNAVSFVHFVATVRSLNSFLTPEDETEIVDVIEALSLRSTCIAGASSTLLQLIQSAPWSQFQPPTFKAILTAPISTLYLLKMSGTSLHDERKVSFYQTTMDLIDNTDKSALNDGAVVKLPRDQNLQRDKSQVQYYQDSLAC